MHLCMQLYSQCAIQVYNLHSLTNRQVIIKTYYHNIILATKHQRKPRNHALLLKDDKVDY